jgi:hypothetical protein
MKTLSRTLMVGMLLAPACHPAPRAGSAVPGELAAAPVAQAPDNGGTVLTGSAGALTSDVLPFQAYSGTVSASLADRDILVLDVANLAKRCQAIEKDDPDLS